MERMSENFSVRVTPSQAAKANALARQLGIKRNQVIGRLIEEAQVISLPQMEVVVAGTVPAAKGTEDGH